MSERFKSQISSPRRIHVHAKVYKATAPYRPTSPVADMFPDITDLINKKPYEVSAPENYARIPEYFSQHNTTPILTPTNNEMSRFMLPISKLIDLTVNNIPFYILNDDDIVDIMKNFCAYLDYLNSVDITGREDFELFKTKCQHFYPIIERMYYGCKSGYEFRTGETLPDPFVSSVGINRLLRAFGI